MLLLERILILQTVKNPRGYAYIRNCCLLHPNSISFMRIPQGIVSVVLWIYVDYSLATLWFAFWMITDLTDGTIARHCKLETDMGKGLDPFSDKCMYLPLLFMFSYQGILSWHFTIIFILCDIGGQASRLFISKTAANSFGKAKTALLTFLLIVIAFSHINTLPFVGTNLIYALYFSCCFLAFLSFYCKIIPAIWYANSLTALNFFCGLAAIYYAFHTKIVTSLILIFVGQFFDLLDGRVARKYGSTKYGALFDDIADGTSFGVAVAFILFRSISSVINIYWAVIVSLVYLISVIFRLYRFLSSKGKTPEGIFLGLPSPAGAMLAGTSAILFVDNPSMIILFTIISSFLMISTIQYKHFGRKIWPKLPNALKLVSFISILVFINFSISNKNLLYFKLICFSSITLYILLAINYSSFSKKTLK